MSEYLTKKTFWSFIGVFMVVLGIAAGLYNQLNESRILTLEKDLSRIQGELDGYKSDMSIEIKEVRKELKNVGETVIRIEETLKRFQ